MCGIKQIFNKEIDRIFKDKKMVFSVFLLPVLIMVVILSIVNGLASNMKDDIESHVAQVYIVNEPEALNDILDASKAKFKLKSIDGAKEMKQAKKEILDGEADLIVEFPDRRSKTIRKAARFLRSRHTRIRPKIIPGQQQTIWTRRWKPIGSSCCPRG